MQVIAMAAADAKSLDPKKVAEATKTGKGFNTVIGNLAYNEKGDILLRRASLIGGRTSKPCLANASPTTAMSPS
jgi:ABC-type branched-subunit amino acid transport system substrate-binding protein